MNYQNIKIFIGNELYKIYKITKTDDDTYEYYDDGAKNLIVLEPELSIIRENDEFKIVIKTNEKHALYKLKEYGYEMNIEINYFDYFIDNNKLTIAYQLETNDKEIKLELE